MRDFLLLLLLLLLLLFCFCCCCYYWLGVWFPHSTNVAALHCGMFGMRRVMLPVHLFELFVFFKYYCYCYLLGVRVTGLF
uniref:Uncharacterized protein n=1 Tax=Anopheles darlingi TaxID=43151 RepID=A0A2M4D744_ANODA